MKLKKRKLKVLCSKSLVKVKGGTGGANGGTEPPQQAAVAIEVFPVTFTIGVEGN